MRLTKSIIGAIFILSSLFLSLQACHKEKPATQEEVEEMVATPKRNFVIFDRGTISVTTVSDEAASIAPLIYHFDEKNAFTADALKKQNPYAKWGYTGSLYLTADKKQLLLCSSQERIFPRNNSADPSFNPDGRLSILDAQTLHLVRQIDFPAFYQEDVRFPSELFAFDDKTIYLYYNESKRAVKIDLTLPRSEMKQVEVPQLSNKILEQVHIYQGRAYILDKTTFGAYQVLSFNPKDDSVTPIKELTGVERIINGDEGLLYLRYLNGAVGIYSLSKQKFELNPTTFDASMGAVYGVAWDRKNGMLYLSFDEEHVRPFIWRVAFADAKNGTSSRLKPMKYAKLEMLTSDSSSGKTRLYVDPNQQKLFAVYFHSERNFQGGRISLFDLSLQKDFATSISTHQVGRPMSNPIAAFSIPRTNN